MQIKQKYCPKCSEVKSVCDFWKDKTSKDSFRYSCKCCIKKTKKKHYINNIEKIKESGCNHYRKNKKYILKKHAEWRLLNPIKISKYRKTHVLYSKYASKLTIDDFPIADAKGVLLVKCNYCGRYLKPTMTQTHSRIQSLDGRATGENRFYCSNECKSACPIFFKKLYPRGYAPSTSREVQPELRQIVLERDNYQCERCHDKTGPLHCHHITGVKINPIESADVDNCITLCKKCHKYVHTLPDCGYNELQCKQTA